MSNVKGWIGLDLDATIAEYTTWQGVEHIGEPVLPMLERIAKWLEEGQPLKIVTARVYCGESGEAPIGDYYRDAQIARLAIEKWCMKYLGVVLPVTCCKNFSMIALYDDRCFRVEPNTGRVFGENDGSKS